MDAMERENTQQSEVRAKLEAAVEKAKEMCEQLQEKTLLAAKATDRTVREHPYEAMGVAFGLGLLIGILAGRRRGD